jgi:undecaprenyl-phosphate 4-deoxy-4-formamido-L-arabinose transferase
MASGFYMSDYGCMLRAYRRHFVDTMLIWIERSTFIPLLANTIARTTTEIHVKHEERAAGDSKYSLLKLINLQFDLLTSMTTAPLRLLTFLGIAIAIFGGIFGLVLLALRLAYGAAWGVNGVFPLFAVLFIFVGTQFMGIGLLGEYIGRIYYDVRARPRFIIESVIGQD